jgi:DNA-binding transcriptional ArsR family regulator
MEDQREVRAIESVEELRALADPVRLAILAALEEPGPDSELPVMSVKELAQRLSQPQTKLYRHVKQLEAAGLIRVAATRMVSGILEQRYQAGQRDLRLSSGLVREHADEAETTIRAAFDAFLEGLADHMRRSGWPDDGPDKPLLMFSDSRVTPEAAERIRAKVRELSNEVARAEKGDVRVDVVVGFHRLGVPAPPPGP